MKPVNSILTIAMAIAALSLAVWFGRYGGKVPIADSQATVKKPDISELPLPTKGPFGKAVTTELSFDFGTVEKGATGSHVFIIKNEGPGPLQVKEGGTSCSQCTFGRVSRSDEIPPGESVEVEIKWNIKAEKSNFRQTATIFTTDPENPKLEFAITGQVDTPLHLIPQGMWMLGDLSGSEPTVAEGMLYSTVLEDEIVVDRWESSTPEVTVSFEPPSKILMTEKQAKSGLKIKVTIAPNIPVGPLRATVKLHSTVRDGTDVEFNISGQRIGPVSMAGSGWVSQTNVFVLGEFSAAEGKKGKLTMYVRDFNGDLEIKQIDPEKSRTQVRVTGSGKSFGKSKVYNVDVEVPPGAPEMRKYREAEPITLKLNHPSVGEFKMFVDYFAK